MTNDSKIEERITLAVEHHDIIDNLLFEGDLNCNDGLKIQWSNQWTFSGKIDALSALIFIELPEREKNSSIDDNDVIATLVSSLERRTAWVKSFLYGWYGLTNKSTSITGFLLGDKLRRKYFKDDK